MPEMRSRISASSSMMRMSCAILGGSCAVFCSGLSRFLATFWKNETNDRARPRSRRVVQLNQPAMVLDDARNDGEAEARALGARRHVRFDEAMSILLREAQPVVDHFELH